MYKSKILLKYIFSEESEVKDLTEEKYNQDYEALTFSFKEETYQSRLAKKTPTKAGYFVTCWTKDENNCNQLNKTAGQTQKWQCKYFFEY
ncbi:hypothetical protein I2Q05_001252 [Staphylococcus aureus]|nr:MepB family protein [Staphylococcus aureus]EGQ1336567.1 hypothetical protein [Staphylococcus aureus]EGQ1435698.1 hypothetical protein [Staphylococcus aureus]EGQ1474643.1 hypothetical protein [Staphylococcus aureus]EGQ1483228.1 hypothetical protein [Staphylococcus aureus]EGQ1492577.1 hypothetical protein [Staphylococcus aureus]